MQCRYKHRYYLHRYLNIPEVTWLRTPSPCPTVRRAAPAAAAALRARRRTRTPSSRRWRRKWQKPLTRSAMVLQLQKYFPYYHFINPIDQNNTIACLWPVVTVSGSNVFCCMNENKLWTLSKNSNLSTYVYTLINFQSLTTLRNRENNPRGLSAFILSKSCNVQGGKGAGVERPAL